MASEEKYLFCLYYTIEGKKYTYFDYFRDRQQAEDYFKFYSAPHIQVLDLKECIQGALWLRDYQPYKESDWDANHPHIWD